MTAVKLGFAPVPPDPPLTTLHPVIQHFGSHQSQILARIRHWRMLKAMYAALQPIDGTTSFPPLP